MFNCDVCKTPTGPRISPIVRVGKRPKVYTFFRLDPETEGMVPASSRGSEIVKEYKLCADCAKAVDAAGD